MPDINITTEELNAAIKALKITVPIYTANKLEDGRIRLVTRHGQRTWKPPAPKKPPTRSVKATRKPATRSKKKDTD